MTKLKYEIEDKPEIEDIKEIRINTEDFDDPEKAEAIIKSLNLEVGYTLKEYDNDYIINPHMVLRGNSPEHYKKTIENLKVILTKKETEDISKYIKRKTESELIRKRIYDSIEERTDFFYWRGKVKKAVADHIKEALEFLNNDSRYGLCNTIYHLLSKGDEDYLICFHCAWQNKPIPNIQEWAKENEGEYRVLTDSEADTEARDYLENDDYLWKEAVESGRTTEGFDDWVETILDYDGRASILSHYDGSEDYQTINGIDYYIYRTN